jgi:hypothetical protein
MQYIELGAKSISRLILGGNPFSGFSHQTPAVDQEMREYFTENRVISLLHEAEGLGINCLVARTDTHILELLAAYGLRDRPIQWLAQTAPEAGSPMVSAERAAQAGAAGCHIHGGVMDYLLAQGRLGEVPEMLRQIRGLGLLAGIAGHRPEVFLWAREHLEVDYFMCAYYNPTPRDQNAAHVHGSQETFLEQDRQAMTELIPTLPAPVIHYKIFAAGRNEPKAAIRFAAGKMRPQDMVCIGVYPGHHPAMLSEDAALFAEAVRECASAISSSIL